MTANLELLALAASTRQQAAHYTAIGWHPTAELYRAHADRLERRARCVHEFVRVSNTPYTVHDECVRCQTSRPVTP